MKSTLIVSVLGLLLVLFAGVRAHANEMPPGAQPVAFVSGAAAAFYGLPGAVKPMSPLVRPARSYCRRDCTICRNDCYARFRVYCHGYSCRRHFVLCMRGCWNNICRWC